MSVHVQEKMSNGQLEVRCGEVRPQNLGSGSELGNHLQEDEN